MAENKRHSNREFREFFQSVIANLKPETASKYNTVVKALDLFLTGHHLHLADVDNTMMRDWALELMSRGLSKATVVRHLNIVNSLLKSAAKKHLVEATESPRTIAKEIERGELTLPILLKETIFLECVDLLRKEMNRETSGQWTEARIDETIQNSISKVASVREDTVKDMLLFSLLNGAISVRELAMLKKEDVSCYTEPSRQIVERNIEPRRAYIFDLRQSFFTPAQIYKAVNSKMKELYGRFTDQESDLDDRKRGNKYNKRGNIARNLKDTKKRADIKRNQDFDADNFIRSLWIACAVKGGATVSEAEACANDCTGSNENRELWIKSVNSMFINDTPRWYVMHIRKGVDYDELRKDIVENIRPVPELFYPSETIRKRVGGRTVIDDKPFISNTVFFKSYPEKVQPMFGRIGDKAWCYRVTRSAGSPYAVISSRDMRRFQAVIGAFTPDTEIHRIGELTLKPGENVIVIKGGYSNREGEVEDIIKNGEGSVLFRVRLTTDSGYEWRVDLDSTQLQKLTKGA